MPKPIRTINVVRVLVAVLFGISSAYADHNPSPNPRGKPDPKVKSKGHDIYTTDLRLKHGLPKPQKGRGVLIDWLDLIPRAGKPDYPIRIHGWHEEFFTRHDPHFHPPQSQQHEENESDHPYLPDSSPALIPSPIPEPSSLLLLATVVAGLAMLERRRRLRRN
jgi:hypothetical protein